MADHITDDRSGTPHPLTLDEFHRPTYEEWYQATLESLNGVPFEKKLVTHTYEGIDLQPIYRREDIATIAHKATLPGDYPYVRGTESAGYVGEPWLIAQSLPYADPRSFNEALHHDLERGQTAINLILDYPSRNGLDPNHVNAGEVGHGGISIASLRDLEAALAGVDLERTPLFIQAGVSALPIAAMLTAHLEKNTQSLFTLRGIIGFDPLGQAARQGSIPLSIEKAYDEMALLTRWAGENAPELSTLALYSDVYHEGGASAIEELAFTLGTGVAYLRAMLQRGLDTNTIAQKIAFTFSVGTHVFIEVAKLRAARLLWAKIVAAFGGSADSQKLQLHIRTSSLNKTAIDPYVNILRTTVEGFAAAVGGCQSLQLHPFDSAIRPPDEFSRRIARNQQLILQKESNLTRLIDPAGGSWYVEYLTDQFAKHAWALFQQVESIGGMQAALEAGFVQQQIESTASARRANIEKRKDVMVGVNMYPNLGEETRMDDDRDRSRAADTEALSKADHLPEILKKLSESPSDMHLLIEAAKAGATLHDLSAALHSGTLAIPPIAPLRISAAFEQLRKAADTYKAQHGTAPQIFLANIGTPEQFRARRDFTVGFYEVGGFELLDNNGFNTLEEAAKAAIESGAPAVVICSTDEAYVQSVPALTQQIKLQKPEMIVILAGYPQDQVENYKVAGVDDFIHIRANCYAMNAQLQQHLGVI